LRVFEGSALKILDGLDTFDESFLPEMPHDTRVHFQNGLEYRGFEQSNDKGDVREFKVLPDKSKFSKSSDIRAYISPKEIWYSAPNARSYSSKDSETLKKFGDAMRVHHCFSAELHRGSSLAMPHARLNFC